MIRILFWFLVWCLCLGFASIKVEYSDGLSIRFFNHRERRQRKQK